MAITDNRTTINDAGTASDWTSDKSPADSSTEFFEPGVAGAAVSDQASDSDFEAYDAITSADYTDIMIFGLVKDALGDTKANGGYRIGLGDGTQRRYWFVAGEDEVPYPLNAFWAGTRLDTSDLPTGFFNEQATNPPTLTTITQVGYGMLHKNKSVGSIDNTWWDRISFIANGSRAVEITGGTSGTPETFTDIVGDDITGGYGVFNNPKGSEFGVFCSVGWGDDGSTASYFDDSNIQMFIDGRNMGAGNMDQVMLANGSAINSFVLDNCVIVNLLDAGDECRANWELNVTNHDICKITNTVFLNSGTISMFTIDNTDKFITGCSFIGCDLITARTGLFQNNKVTTPKSQGVLISSNSHQIDGTDFDLTGGTGPLDSLVIDTAGTYDIDACNWTGGSAGSSLYDINNTSVSGAVIVNVTNSDNAPSEANSRSTAGGTLTINVAAAITITVIDSAGLPISEATSAVYYNNSGVQGAEIMNTDTNASGVASGSFTDTTPQDVFIRIRKNSDDGYTRYFPNASNGEITGDGLTVTVTLIEDSIAGSA